MNCIKHIDTPAVSTCANCGGGLCSNCFEIATKNDGKPTCIECALYSLNEYIDELTKTLKKLNTRKIIWTIILLIGMGFIIYGYFFIDEKDISTYIVGFFIWGFGGFLDKFKKTRESSMQDAVRDGMMERDMMKDGSIWIYLLLKLVWFIIRGGVFFPLFYIYFMIFGTRKLESELKNMTEYKITLEQKI